MFRNEWKFEYTAAKLADATRAKSAYHGKHLDFWKKKREELLTTIRAEGIEVDEKIAIAYSSSGPKARDWERGGDVMIRNDLRRRLLETFEKLAYHTRALDTYAGWQQILDANPEHRLALDIDDWLFFFGRDTSSDRRGADEDYLRH
jgi:hypothetical protein